MKQKCYNLFELNPAPIYTDKKIDCIVDSEFETKNLMNGVWFVRCTKSRRARASERRKKKNLTERGVFLTENVEAGRLERHVIGGYNVSVCRQM